MTTVELDVARGRRAAVAPAVLLVAASAAAGERVGAVLAAELPHARVTMCHGLATARTGLAGGTYDAVVVDLSSRGPLPPSAVVDVLRAAAPGSALVALLGSDDHDVALDLLGRGAQEVLVTGRDDDRTATCVLHAIARRQAERTALAGLAQAQAVLDALEAPTCAVDADSRIVAVNRAWRDSAVAGGGDPQACGEGADYLAACAVDAAGTADAITGHEVATGLRDVIAGRVDRYHAEYPCHSPEEQRWFSVRMSPAVVHGRPGAVVTHVDVTAMREAQESLSHRVLHDALTGLPNRCLLTDRLQQALADSSRRGTGTAVAFVDLDHFKRVNDRLGHPAGDALLVQVAERLLRQVRAGDTVARFSGDEFVIVWRDLRSPAEAELLSARLSDALLLPFDVAGSSVVVTASVGVAVGRSPQTPEELLLAADAAMYDAKGHGRGRVRVFSADLHRDAEERRATEVALRAALARDELVLHYQPVVDLRTGQAVAVEALVRWQHPELGLLGPDHFIPVAEMTGQIVPLGRWVLDRACRDAAAWTGDAAGLDVAVNLSVRQLSQPDVLRHVRDALAVSGLAPERLLLEVTESAVMEDAEAAGIALDALCALGVRIAIDDFGTGYSSLLYLRRYPISALKVDRAFVSGMGASADDDAICSSVVSLAHAVGAVSIAEGVESAEQYAALRVLGCQLAQGFLWSPAVTVDRLPAAVAAARLVPVPEPGPRRRRPGQPLDGTVRARMAQLHDGGASLHTIAAALNREGAAHPGGVRWHAHAVARHIADGSPDEDRHRSR